jgi:hypothetical protein
VPRTENLCETGATAHQLERSSPVDPAIGRCNPAGRGTPA